MGRFSEYNLTNDEARALILCREKGGISNVDYRDINRVDTLEASQHLVRLRELGVLESRGKGPATHYVLKFDNQIYQAGDEIYQAERQIYQAEDEIYQAGLEKLISELPDDILILLKNIGKKSTQEKMRNIVIKLCFIKAYTIDELSLILCRNKKYLATFILKPLMREGVIKHIYPDKTHPYQKYLCVENEK